MAAASQQVVMMQRKIDAGQMVVFLITDHLVKNGERLWPGQE